MIFTIKRIYYFLNINAYALQQYSVHHSSEVIGLSADHVRKHFTMTLEDITAPSSLGEHILIHLKDLDNRDSDHWIAIVIR
jgi:hypothetical protein